MNNDYKWDDPSGTFRRRTDLVKSYIACKNGLPPEMVSPTSRHLKQALFDHYQHMWPSFVAKENFTRQQYVHKLKAYLKAGVSDGIEINIYGS